MNRYERYFAENPSTLVIGQRYPLFKIPDGHRVRAALGSRYTVIQVPYVISGIPLQNTVTLRRRDGSYGYDVRNELYTYLGVLAG